MDISNFMSWFISQVVNIFTFTFNTLNSIQFLGTSLLKVILTISILIPLLGVVLTIAQSKSISNVDKFSHNHSNKKGGK